MRREAFCRIAAASLLLATLSSAAAEEPPVRQGQARATPLGSDPRRLIGRSIHLHSQRYTGAATIVWAQGDGRHFEVLAKRTGAKFTIDDPRARLEPLSADQGHGHGPTIAAPTTDAEMDRLLAKLGDRARGLYRANRHDHFAEGPLRVAQQSPRVYSIGAHEFDLPTLEARQEMLVVYDGSSSETRNLDPRLPPFSLNVLTRTPVSAMAKQEAPLYRLVRDLEQQGNVFAGPVLYDTLSKHPEWVGRLVSRWYEEQAPELLRRGAFLQPQHRVLLLDPGLVSRLDAFASCYQRYQQAHPQAGAAAVRRAFSDELGSETVWRGIMLQGDEQAVQQQVAAIRGAGSSPGVFRVGRGQLARSLFDPELSGRNGRNGNGPTGILDALATHISGDTWVSPLISVSPHREVAEMASWDDLHRCPTDGRFCLLKLKVPRLSLIATQGPLAGPRLSWPEHLSYTRRTPDGREFKMKFRDLSFEQFITDMPGGPAIEEAYLYGDNPGPWWRQ